MTFEPIEHEPDDYGPDDAPARPSAGRTGRFWRRFWRSLTGRRTGSERCRPVTVTGDDGQPVYATVLGGQPMSDETREAFGEIVRAAQRKHAADLRAKRQAADDDVRTVARLLKVAEKVDFSHAGLAEWFLAFEALENRFAARIDALIERDAKPPTAQPCRDAISIGAMPYACVLPEGHDGEHSRVMWHSPGWQAEAERAARDAKAGEQR